MKETADSEVKQIEMAKGDGEDGVASGPIQVIRSVKYDADAREAAIAEILASPSPCGSTRSADVAERWMEALAAELPAGRNWLAAWDPEAAKLAASTEKSPDELICVDVERCILEGLQAEVMLLSVPKGMEAELEENAKDNVPKVSR